ncbi:DUF4179 domain-containing protein [Clostridium manihotivorum]|uniref:DUF4179 domain-containing protein n=1 Tax=Clostridium manihotivorum TaxID=2320868 RepID=A0A410DVC9_9CLOT|nr:DUF4179 domain-containing protein [Clostridium manihotivorum]QAA33031.1 hypothetical protein C1I91_16070 [Clostridium manihotivorum]
MNSLDGIKLPDDIDILTENAVKRGEKYKEDKKRYKKKFAIAASICLVTTISITSICVGAKSIEYSGNIFSELKQLIGIRGNYKENKSINKTITDKDVSLTLQEVLCDEYGVYVSFVVKSKEAFVNTKDTQLLIYDEYAKTSFNKGNLDNGGKAGLEGKFIDNKTFIGVESYLFKNLNGNVPKNFNLGITIGALSLNGTEDNNIVRGNWKFSVPVTLNGEGVKVITPSIRHGDIVLKKVTLSKLNTFIEMEMPLNSTKQKVDLYTDKGVNIDSISTEFNESDGKVIVKQRFNGVPDDVNKLIVNFEDSKSIEVSIN